MADNERIGLHNLKPAPRLAQAAQARRPRRGLGLRQDLRPRPEGRRRALGRKKRVRFEGGQKPIHMRMRKLRGPHMKKSMPFEQFRTQTQPVNLRDLEARFDKGAEVTPDSLRENGLATPQGRAGQGPRPGRADQEADGARPRLLASGAREDRGRGRQLRR